MLGYRPYKIDNVDRSWLWPIADTVAWTNPIRDWVGTHRDKWLGAVRNRGVCVQAGGNCGLYPRLLAEHFDMVYTFEPDPQNFLCLVANCDRDNIVKIQGALGCRRELVAVQHLSDENVGMHRVGGSGTIPTFTVDNLGLNACDFIQLDVEGYEVNALLGALETIKRFRPVISVELGRGPSPESTLKNLGYEFAMMSEDDALYIPKELK